MCSGAVVATLITYPAQVIHVRFIQQSLNEPKYKGIVDTMKTIAKEEGISSLYRGIVFDLLGILATLIFFSLVWIVVVNSPFCMLCVVLYECFSMIQVCARWQYFFIGGHKSFNDSVPLFIQTSSGVLSFLLYFKYVTHSHSHSLSLYLSYYLLPLVLSLSQLIFRLFTNCLKRNCCYPTIM
jgi:hypothetical protein